MKINHVTLLVSNKKQSEKFYIESLGFSKKEVGEHLWIDIGEQYIHLTQNSGKPVTDTFYHFAIEVDDLFAYVEKLKEKGVSILNFSENKMQIFIKDPDGNMIEFIDSKDKFFK